MMSRMRHEAQNRTDFLGAGRAYGDWEERERRPAAFRMTLMAGAG